MLTIDPESVFGVSTDKKINGKHSMAETNLSIMSKSLVIVLGRKKWMRNSEMEI